MGVSLNFYTTSATSISQPHCTGRLLLIRANWHRKKILRKKWL